MKVPHVRFCNTSSVHCTACSSQPQSSLLCHHVFVLSLLFHIRSIRSSCSAFQIYPESDACLKRSMATTIFSDPDYGHILLAHLPASTCASPPCPCSLLNRENRSILFKNCTTQNPSEALCDLGCSATPLSLTAAAMPAIFLRPEHVKHLPATGVLYPRCYLSSPDS